MSVRKIASKEEFKGLMSENALVIVDYFATWCPPCRMIAPWLEEQAKAFDGKVVFAKVDVDELEDVAAEQKIQCMPTFEFFKGGAAVARIEGADKAGISSKIEQLA
ncbi:Oidioi.mRNA.OKI2018_I69.PAR.g12267.t1.cds [Oikopleura dioica]|uniref:Thioredoxin n=1 Tax=Oikopleura dioica TaxID=34765 RepID=A0ABN7RZB7_OIKDI|nr:Oidioi.mRNA.OKI2018_I69.PAR.g12267.t1.cds [Oikopleura dioica]